MCSDLNNQQDDQWPPQNAFEAWKWDGVSVDTIVAQAEKCGFDLESIVQDYPAKTAEFLSNVPVEYQGFIRGADQPGAANDENSLAGTSHHVEIVAFDQQGMALVANWVSDKYTGGEGLTVEKMSQQDALQLVDQYRLAAKEPPIAYVKVGSQEMPFYVGKGEGGQLTFLVSQTVKSWR